MSELGGTSVSPFLFVFIHDDQNDPPGLLGFYPQSSCEQKCNTSTVPPQERV
jgi:hypothetical protein